MSSSHTHFRNRDDARPKSPAFKISKWFSRGSNGASMTKIFQEDGAHPSCDSLTTCTHTADKHGHHHHNEPLPAASKSVNKLRARLLAIRGGDGSFSSSQGTPGDKSPLSVTPTTATNAADTPGGESGVSFSGWRISAKSPTEEECEKASLTPYSVARRRKSSLPPPKTPPSASRLRPQHYELDEGGVLNMSHFEMSPPPQSPLQVQTPTATPPRTPPPPIVVDEWDAQLGALDQLSKQLSLAASQVEDCWTDIGESKGEPTALTVVKSPTPPPRRHSRDRRSLSPDPWKKFEELAARLKQAQDTLKALEEDNDTSGEDARHLMI